MAMISVIVPIYNAEKHIEKLISSVISQALEDWELILVDDGSNDNSWNICKEAASIDSRIRVFHQDNQGPSAARNLGLTHACGEWISFVDADDSILDCFLSSLLFMTSHSNSIDLVYSGYVIVEQRDKIIYSYDTKVYNGFEEVKNALAYSQILHRCCPWGKLFRRSIISDYGIRFDTKLKHSEDRLFVYNYLMHIRGLATSSVIGYLYDSTSPTSLKNKRLSIEKLEYRQATLTRAALQLKDFYQLKGEEVFMLTKHLMVMLTSAIEGIFYIYGRGRKTELIESCFLEKHMEKSLYIMVINCERWKKIVSTNQNLQMVLNKDFNALNNKLNRTEFHTQLFNLIHKFIPSRENSLNFSHTIKKLN